MATGVLEVFDKNTRESVIDVLIIRYFPELGMDCLELAVLCKCQQFVSSSTVQRILDYIWHDTRNECFQIVMFLFCIKLTQFKNYIKYYFRVKRIGNF